MTETELRSKLHTVLRSQNAIVAPYVPSKYTGSGVSDALVVHNYWRGMIEAKAFTGRPTQAQIDFADLVSQRGFPAAICWFVRDSWSTKPEDNMLRIKVMYRGFTQETVSDAKNLLKDLRSVTYELRENYRLSPHCVVEHLANDL